MLSTSEFVFRYCLSIAESYVRNWMKFPVPLTASNSEKVFALLNRSNIAESELGTFSLELLDEIREALICVNTVVVEIIRSVSLWSVF